MSILTDKSHQPSTDARSFVAPILVEHVVNIFLELEAESELAQWPVHAYDMDHLGLEHDEFREIAVDILNELRHRLA